MKKAAFILSLLLVINIVKAQIIEKTYYFSSPSVTHVDGYDQISFDGCRLMGENGCPMLPWQAVSLLLPQGTDAQTMEVVYSDFVEMDGKFNLIPYQRPLPLSKSDEYEFYKNEAIYASSDVYPEKVESKVGTHYLNGCSFAFAGFTPLRYEPSIGKVSYARRVTVRIGIENSREDKTSMLRLSPENSRRIANLAQNPEALDEYMSRYTYDSGYELLVVTGQEWVEKFAEYKAFYEERGLRTKVMAIEDICEIMSGRDDQEKIRNYIKNQYENEGIIMVCLGGDVNIVPYRALYCLAWEGGDEDIIPSDSYYCCLDGTLDDDGDGIWGEHGEDDLLPEVAVGRLPFSNEAQFDIIMHKIFSYQATPVLGEFRKVLLGAEWLSDGYSGSFDMQKLIGECSDFGYTTVGIPEDYNINKLWAEFGLWSGHNFAKAFNEGTGYVHHAGHANTDYVAGWYNNTVNENTFSEVDGIKHNYIFFHSHGCICGDFAHDCIMERLVTMRTNCVAVTGNSRYGWYAQYGDGPAAHLDRELADSYYHDRLPYIGTAFQEMKTQTAPFVVMSEYDDCLRWNYYALNIIGDVAICPWLDEPFTPEVNYSAAIATGTTSTEVTVKKDNAPQSNFRCSLFHDGQRVAFGLTNENGVANLAFNEASNIEGDMQLIVTGPNAWPTTYDVKGVNNNEAYVIMSSYSLSNATQILTFGDELYMNINIANIGNAAAQNVNAVLSCDSEYITIGDAELNVGDVNPSSETHFDNAFAFTVSDATPDNTYVTFTMTFNCGSSTWSQPITLKVHSPLIEILTLDYEDSYGESDHCIDPGETISVLIDGFNNGSATAQNLKVKMEVTEGQQYVSIPQPVTTVGIVNPAETFSASIDFVVADEVPNGELMTLHITAFSGEHSYAKDLRLVIGKVIEDYETGDFKIRCEMEGNAPWIVTNSIAHQGLYSAESGNIGDDEVSSMFVSLQITVDGEVSFFVKTSTEKRCDILAFFIDDVEQDRWSGENDWTYVTYPVSAGSHVFEWRYDKNKNKTSGADRCWIDDVLFPSNTIVITDVTETIEEQSILIYPNPTNGNFTVKCEEMQNIAIFNIQGQKIMDENVSSDVVTIDAQSFTAGIYFVRTTDKNGRSLVQRVIKR